MPTIEQSLMSNLNVEGLRVSHPEPPTNTVARSVRNVFHRCPVPPISSPSVDNLDQFDLQGVVPQFRVFVS